MATAEKKTVTRIVETKVEEEVVNLQLSKDEAESLQAVLCFVGGHDRYSRRGHIDSISAALSAAGFRILTGPAYEAIKDGSDLGVVFADEEGLKL